MSKLLPLRLAGLALILSVASASAADDAVSPGGVTRDSATAVVTVQPASAPADAGKAAVTAAAQKAAATDLGAARAAVAKRVATPAPRVIRHATPQHARLGCSGAWCGRQFVLMLGVAY